MARDRANLRIDIWADQDWRELSPTAQHLYVQMLSHGSLSYAGVMDWKPGRLAAMSRGRAREDVERDAAELESGRFVLVDTDTEEALIRSFLKHDGVLKQPKIVVSMTNAFACIASPKIREVIAYEVQKLREREPDLRAWEVPQVRTILNFKAKPIEDVAPGFTPGFPPDLPHEFGPEGDRSQGLPTTTSTTTSTSSSNEEDSLVRAKRKAPETPLPSDWIPSESATKYATENNIDIQHEVMQFRNHAAANDRRQRNWDAAFRTWLGNAKKWSRPQQSQMTAADRNAQAFRELYGGGDEVQNSGAISAG